MHAYKNEYTKDQIIRVFVIVYTIGMSWREAQLRTLRQFVDGTFPTKDYQAK